MHKPDYKNSIVNLMSSISKAVGVKNSYSSLKQFETYVNKKLKHLCWLYKSEDLIKKNFFGLFKPHPKLKDRIGDYTLIMKENYVFKDQLIHQNKKHFVKGNHSGVSKEEMYVPLIIVEL